jgi:hypothetical protein
VLDFVENKVFAAARPKDQAGGQGYDVKLADAVKAALPFVDKSFPNEPLIEARLRLTMAASFRDLGEPGTYGAAGGAVFNHSSAATFIRCTFTGNQAVAGDGGKTNSTDLDFGGGGAIWSEGNSLLTVEQGTFTRNQALGGNGGTGTGSNGFIGLASGGAILNFGNATLVVDATTFSSNQAIGGSYTSGTGAGLGMASGGCIQNEGAATITNSSFNDNGALAGCFNTGSGSTIVGRAVGGAINNRPVNGGVGTVTASGDSFNASRASGP